MFQARTHIMLSLALAMGRGDRARDVFIGVNVLDRAGLYGLPAQFIAAFGPL